ncbi:MAG: 1-acyl-sn-glycerol-3-phosphate acyltransferase [Tannerellaceae bacterium]|jgi:1-acyl-sn-glycerol-3-phosphate acyltransferase|nr:1-acyl-sn-glycerol-3-phosphate acyltransferase [Tannerellaceae bacterium]
MIRFFISIYTYFLSRRRWLAGSLFLLIAAGFLSVSHLKYKEDIGEFLPDKEANAHINRLYRHISRSSRLIVNFSVKDTTAGNDEERIMEAIDRFTLFLQEEDSLCMIPEIISQIDESRMFEVAGFIRQNIPYFLTEADYARLDSITASETAVASLLEENKRLLMLPSGGLMQAQIPADPLHLFTPVLEKLKDFQAGSQEEINGGYLFSHTNGRTKGRVLITSPYGVSETAQNAALLQMIDRAIERTAALSPDMHIRCFGAPAIAVTNANQIKKDSLLAISLSVVLILALLIYFFRNLRNIGLIFLSVSFGWLFALAWLTLFKDSISVIAIGIGSIFIGIAINYPLHLVDHIRHQPHIRQALKEIIPPLLIGNITTAGAFLSLVFIPSDAMRDLGWFGSLLLAGTILFVLVYLPHMVKAGHPGADPYSKLPLSRWASFAPDEKKWVVWPVLLLTVCFAYFARFTTFEPDMNRINYMTPQQREDMHDMMQSLERTGRDVVYFISEGASTGEALAVYEQNTALLDSLKRTGLIESISGTGVFLASPEEQQKRIRRWEDFWKPRREALLQQIETAALAGGFRPGAFEPFSRLLYAGFEPRDEAYFAPLTTLLADNYLIRDSVENRYTVIHLLYCDKERTSELTEALRQSSAGAFPFDSRNIGQRVVDSLSDNFNYVLYVCGFIVFIFLTISFGRLELSLLAFLPLAVSWIWILGIMQLGDMRFNIVNIILATFIFGQGDDYTIFITEGLMYEYAYRRKMLNSYKNSIVLSALIMFTGIGTLIFARHPALRSLAEVTIVGMFSVVLIAYIIPPLLFHWFTKTKTGFRKVPVTLKRLLFSLYSFLCFLLGSFVITLIGFFLFGFGHKQERRKMRYHSVLRWVAHFVIKRIPGVRFSYQNLSGETFEKPAVIICNHQSHLDLMCLMMLTPRMVILTNDWVWNNPFYGRLIKYADFYPVSNGVSASLDKLSGRVRQGYSIVVFPEGTRSNSRSILRFRRGAFYLAETLHLDILPVFIHGTGHVLPKEDFMLREGSVTVQVHPRIPADHTGYGAGYAIRSKRIRQYYSRTFAAISQQMETATYFRWFVLHNYLYKGAGIAYSVRSILSKTRCFAEWIDSCPSVSSVLIVNNGYGVLGFLFALVHTQTQVTAIDRDADNVALARNCAGIPDNLTIYEASELTEDAGTFDAVYLWNPDELQREAYRMYNPQIIETRG